MASKVKCPHCEQMTYDTPSCGRCGKPLRGQGETDQAKVAKAKVSFKYGLVDRAADVQRRFKEVVLAQFKAVRSDADESAASAKIVVKKDRRQFVYTSYDKSPTMLSEGVYSLGTIKVAGREPAQDAGHLTCEVPEAPVSVTFALPDTEAFSAVYQAVYDDDGKRQEEIDWDSVRVHIDEALNSFSLRTADDVIGGAVLQLRLRCIDPLRLMRCFNVRTGSKAEISPTPRSEGTTQKAQISGHKGQPLVIDEDAKPGDDDTLGKGEKRIERRGLLAPLRKAWDWFMDYDPVQVTFQTSQITLADLYPSIRLELAEAMGNSIRNLRAEDLYDKQDANRAILHARIKEYMEKTLSSYGLQIADVVAFQFRSPDYEELLQRRGKVGLERQDLGVERSKMEVERERREIHHEDFEHAEQIEEKKDHLKLEREARLMERVDQVTIQHLDRAHDVKRREISLADLDAEQQHKQALRALELHEKLQQSQLNAIEWQRAGEHERRLAAIKLIAGYPPEQQFLLAMQYNPELQQAYIAMQQARSNDDRLAMAQQFQGQVQAIYGDQSKQTNELLIQAAKQLGLIMSSKAKADTPPRPQQVVIQQIPPPQQG